MDAPGLRSTAGWSFLLQASRLGGNAIVFLVMARFLTIAEIGAFGLAFAPVRWSQDIFKVGITQAALLRVREDDAASARDMSALVWLSLALALLVALAITGAAAILSLVAPQAQDVPRMMLAMGVVPLSFGCAAVAEGRLQKRLHIRALALRTLAAQLLAAAVAGGLAYAGAGPWALVAFAAVNAVVTSGLALALAGLNLAHRPDRKRICGHLPDVATLSAPPLISGATLTMLQLASGLAFGLEGAGAYQIAQRVFQLLDALCLAPLRFLVLPILSRKTDANAGTLPRSAVSAAMQIAGLVAAPVYVGALVFAPQGLALVIGPENGQASALALQILCLTGYGYTASSLVAQVAIAAGQARLVMIRSLWLLCVTAVLILPALALSLPAMLFAYLIASYVVLGLFLRALDAHLPLRSAAILGTLAKPFLAAGIAAAPAWGLLRAFERLADLPLPLAMTVALSAGLMLYAAAVRIIAPEAWHVATRPRHAAVSGAG